MKITSTSSDRGVLAELGERLGRIRLNRNLSQQQLAREAGISKRTLERIEAGESTQLATLIRVLRALELSANFDRLIPEPTPSPIEQLKLQGKTRERASRQPEPPRSTGSEWSWNE